MQRMYNLDKWTEISDGNGLHFTNPRPRKVSIEVNAPTKTALSVMDHQGEVHFLALVEGRDTLEFHSLGEFSLLADNGGCMIYTADGADISSVVIAPVSLTKVMERRKRNPELEAFAHQMQRNMEATLDRQAKDFERRIQQRFEAASELAASKAGAPPPEPAPRAPETGGSDGPLQGPRNGSGGGGTSDDSGADAPGPGHGAGA